MVVWGSGAGVVNFFQCFENIGFGAGLNKVGEGSGFEGLQNGAALAVGAADDNGNVTARVEFENFFSGFYAVDAT